MGKGPWKDVLSPQLRAIIKSAHKARRRPEVEHQKTIMQRLLTEETKTQKAKIEDAEEKSNSHPDSEGNGSPEEDLGSDEEDSDGPPPPLRSLTRQPSERSMYNHEMLRQVSF